MDSVYLVKIQVRDPGGTLAVLAAARRYCGGTAAVLWRYGTVLRRYCGGTRRYRHCIGGELRDNR